MIAVVEDAVETAALPPGQPDAAKAAEKREVSASFFIYHAHCR